MSADVNQLIQELVVPELREMKAEIKGLQIEIKRLEEKIDLQSSRLDEKIDAQGAKFDDKIEAYGAKLDDRISSLRNEMLSLRNEMMSEFLRLDERVDLTVHVRERLVSLKTPMAAYKNRN